MRQALRWLAWFGATVASLALLSQPVGTQAQLAMSLAAMAVMIVLWAVFDGPRTRFVFLALGSLVVLRYILLAAHQHAALAGRPCQLRVRPDPAGGRALLRLHPVRQPDHQRRPAAARPAAGRPGRRPTDRRRVRAELQRGRRDPRHDPGGGAAARTTRPTSSPSGCSTTAAPTRSAAMPTPAKAAAARARRSELQALCDELGVRYLTRARNEHAKAGNLNNGLAHARRRHRGGARRRSRAVPLVPARDRRLFRTGSAACSWFRHRTPSSTPTRSSATCEPSSACRRRTRCSTRSRSAASTSGTARSSAARQRCCAAPPSMRPAASRASPSRRIARPPSSCTRAAGPASTSTSR